MQINYTEKYCSQLNQAGIVFKFDVNPAKIKKGIKINGPTEIAVLISLNKLPTIEPQVNAIMLAKTARTTI